jgi:hypothetical protein
MGSCIINYNFVKQCVKHIIPHLQVGEGLLKIWKLETFFEF